MADFKSYRGKDLADGGFDLEFRGPGVHVSTHHVRHRLEKPENQCTSTGRRVKFERDETSV